MAVYKEKYEQNRASFTIFCEFSISSNLEYFLWRKYYEVCFYKFAGC